MKCTEFRDLAELLRDKDLEGPVAAEARSHLDRCIDCSEFEAECAAFTAPLTGFPPGPYAPPLSPRRFPPWVPGSALGVLLALVVGAGILAVGQTSGSSAGKGRSTVADAAGRRSATRAPGPSWGGPSRGGPSGASLPIPPATRSRDPAAGVGTSLAGRVVDRAGDGGGRAGVRVLLDGVEVATTDTAGLFTVRGLGTAGWRSLRLEPPGAAPVEAAVPYLEPGESHILGELALGPAAAAAVRVLGMDARPVAGALVRACRLAPTLHPDSHPDWQPDEGGRELPTTARAVADADGTASFPALSAGEWSFQAEADGRPPSRPVGLRLDGEAKGSATLLLDPGTVLEGRVLDDATGTPVAGAVVRWTRVVDIPRGHDLRYSGRETAGPDGAFRFPSAPAVPLLLQACRPGATAPAGGLGVDGAALGRVDLRLPREATLAGSCVQSGTGLPAAGVDLRIRLDLRAGVFGFGGLLHARSGPDGRFEVRGLPEGSLVQVGPVPFGAWIPAAGDDGSRPPGTPRRVEVTRAGTILGTARDGAGGPARGRVVEVLISRRPFRQESDIEEVPPMAGIASRALSGADGTFRLENVPPGAAAVYCPGPDAALRLQDHEVLATLEASPRPGFVVAVPPGGETTVQVSETVAGVDPGAVPGPVPDRIEGCVLGTGGVPVPGVRLSVLPGDLEAILRRPGSYLLRIPTGTPVPVAPGGSFQAEVPPSGRTADARGRAYTLVASAPGHPPAVSVVHAAQGAPSSARIELEDGVSLQGRIRREDGSPAAGCLLEAVPAPDARSPVNPVMVEARTAEDGTFRIDGLAPCLHTLVVGRAPGPVHRVPGLRPGGDPLEVRLPAGDGERAERPTVPARSSPPPRTGPEAPLRGRIGVDGEGAARILRIEIFDADRGLPIAAGLLADADGHFEGKAPRGSRVSVAAMAEDGRWAFADDVPAGETGLVLRLGGTPTGLLHGRVVTPAGTPASGIPVHAVRLRDRTEGPAVVRFAGGTGTAITWEPGLVPEVVRTTFTEPDGGFDLGSPPGRWTVFAGLPGSEGLAPGAAAPWTAADSTPLELSTGPGRVLSFTAVDGDAPPGSARAAAAELVLDGFLPGGGAAVAVRVAPRPGGGFAVPGVPAGPVTVLLLDAAGKEIGRAAATPGDPRDPPVKVPLVR